MTATDVIMMGRLAADALSDGSLGSNFVFTTMIFSPGLYLARIGL
jgi:MATE family multidrug resistance protein